MTVASATLSTVDIYLYNREPFVCNRNLRSSSTSTGVGQLPEAIHKAFRAAAETKDFYTVYSYETPIAWYANGEWTVPKVNYSQATTRQQNIIRRTVRVKHEPTR